MLRNTGISIGIIISAIFLSISAVWAEDLQSARYEVLVGYFNSDGKLDILLRGQDLFVPIGLDEVLIPIIVKPKFDTVVITSFSDGTYAIDDTAQQTAIDQTQWQEGDYQLLYGNFSGDGSDELFLRSTAPGNPSFIFSGTGGQTKPALTQQFLPETFGLDFGAPGVDVQLSDRNSDGRTDITVTQGDMILAVLLASSGGTFSPVGDKTEDLDATIGAIWSGFGLRLDNGEANKAMEYFSVARQADYERIFVVLGDGIRDLTANWSQAVPLIVEKDYAEYAVTQTINGQTRMHIIGFIRDSDGQWMIDQL